MNAGVFRPVCARRRCYWWRFEGGSAIDLSVRPEEGTRLPLVGVGRVFGAKAHVRRRGGCGGVFPQGRARSGPWTAPQRPLKPRGVAVRNAAPATVGRRYSHRSGAHRWSVRCCCCCCCRGGGGGGGGGRGWSGRCRPCRSCELLERPLWLLSRLLEWRLKSRSMSRSQSPRRHDRTSCCHRRKAWLPPSSTPSTGLKNTRRLLKNLFLRIFRGCALFRSS